MPDDERSGQYVIDDSCMKRTLLAVVIAVVISLMIAPHSGGHAPIFVARSQIDVKQLVLQTIFLAVLLAVIVNLEPRRK